MRTLLLAIGTVAAVVAWLVWAAARDLREPWTPFPEDEDGVQPADWPPYLVSTPIGRM